jgi:cytochrome c6
MRKALIVTAAMLSLSAFATPGFSDTKKGENIDAKHEFEEHCASCHPKGGNIINAKKTLSKKSLAADGIKTDKDIVAKMRNPGPGMTKFDEKAISAKEAKAIADYILKTFR